MRRALRIAVDLAVIVGTALLAILVLATLARAHTDTELQAEIDALEATIATTPGGADLNLEPLRRLRALRAAHPCREAADTWGPHCQRPSSGPQEARSATPGPTGANTGMGNNVERWRDVVSAHFGANTDAALRVMACESGGNPHAQHPASRASGLFQFLPSTWTATTGQPYPGDVFDGPSNIAAAAQLSGGGTSWAQWSCKP